MVVRGVVCTANGSPVPAARVYFVDGPVPLPDIAAFTDSEGTFAMTAPQEGAYTLECTVEGYAPAKMTFEFASDAEIHVTIRLQPL
jgi:hypothetical protein